MIKLVCLLKKKAGMSREAFIQRYEQAHALFAVQHLPNARHYERRYIAPFGNPVNGSSHESNFDVVTEIWFDDRASLEAAMGNVAQPEIAALFAADEEHLFDRACTRLFTVDQEISTELPDGEA